jgi:hypothetical protein
LKFIKKNHPKLHKDDSIRDIFDKIFSGKVGEAFNTKEIENIKADGKGRYEKNIPPGFKDKAKTSDNEYGDLIIWKELIKKSKSDNKPLIFVTDEKKVDWWNKSSGETIGPHPLLIEEFIRETGQSFYMYSSGAFYKLASEKYRKQVNESTLSETKAVEIMEKHILAKTSALEALAKAATAATFTVEAAQKIQESALREAMDAASTVVSGSFLSSIPKSSYSWEDMFLNQIAKSREEQRNIFESNLTRAKLLADSTNQTSTSIPIGKNEEDKE